MGLEGQADLHHAEAQQDKTDGSNQPEDEAGQVVDDGDGVAGSECRDRGAENERSAHNGGAVDAEALSDLAGHRELVGMLFGVFLKDVHIRFLRYFEDWFSSKSSSDSNT